MAEVVLFVATLAVFVALGVAAIWAAHRNRIGLCFAMMAGMGITSAAGACLSFIIQSGK